MRKILPALFCICLCCAILGGCKGPRIDAASSVKAIYDLYILGDKSGILSLGMTEEDIAAAQRAYDDSLKEAIRTNFSASGQEIEENVLDELCAARKKALAHMEATFETIEESDGKATVVLHTTFFDEPALDEEAYYNAKEAAQQGHFDTLEQQQAFLMDRYTQNLMEAYGDVVPSKETHEIQVECVIHNKIWVPANMSSFGGDLASAIAGQP